MKKKTGYKAQLLKVVEENPNLKDKIEKSIKTTEGLLETYLEALNNWKTAVRDAKERYDKEGGLTGKVKNFFGFDSGKQDDMMFGDYSLQDEKFTVGNKYTIKDILKIRKGCILAQSVVENYQDKILEHWKDEDLNYLLDAVDKMYNSASTAVSFNLLSPINNEIHDGHFYVHPGLILDMLIEKYQLVTVKHNYSNSIYTVTIYKY